jgi:mannosyltransferase OCH1-like enzyme
MEPIPRVIYQTWCTKNMPPKMRERVESLKAQNPDFEHQLFDNDDCRRFIEDNFKPESGVLMAFDKLIPGAYKADLWRYCVLYKNGGIYMDMKVNCVKDFKLRYIINKEHYVLDRFNCGIYSAFMCCRKGNPFLFRAIQEIVQNVATNYYGICALSPTGPRLLKNVCLKYNFKLNIDMKHYEGGGFIIFKNKFVMACDYPGYDMERNTSGINRYHQWWEERNIYQK